MTNERVRFSEFVLDVRTRERLHGDSRETPRSVASSAVSFEQHLAKYVDVAANQRDTAGVGHVVAGVGMAGWVGASSAPSCRHQPTCYLHSTLKLSTKAVTTPFSLTVMWKFS